VIIFSNLELRTKREQRTFLELQTFHTTGLE